MSKRSFSQVLTDLPDDMLAVILGKVGEESALTFKACIISCKTFGRISKFTDVMKILNVNEIFPAPWEKERLPPNTDMLYECAKHGNIDAIFLCGLIDFYFKKELSTGIAQLSYAAEATHPEAMYLYGMLLINQGKLDQGSNYITQLWKNQGMEVVNRCRQNCRPVVLEITVREYRDYDMLLTEIQVGDECVVGEFDEVCDDCFIYKEIFRFIDYMHYA